ncbi:hypothetical protein [Streptomyces europaeiscabiei]|uniref:hypothetical protein n=1 Tax=Streptomyces europaeiscabiei TaxID=146819 RepID=UPI0029B8D553|nr:hypothetical protein [Streptomyces europaeiscabiei]MDX2771230.1 hypothetical protein [Streptomyces europaeiscabiei]
MGFSGHLVFARCGRPLLESPVFDGIDHGLKGTVQPWLNLDRAAALLAEEPEDLDDLSLWMGTPEFDQAVRRKRAELEPEVPADAAAALAWASAADVHVTAQQPRIEELLRSRGTFAEDLFSALLDERAFQRPPSPDQSHE